jgi:alkanesulfonate monooxygenase SsuD/methylene tetrahydromethanopterin reductase-like flavin-dependent oxidoreductase (luciferase family)
MGLPYPPVAERQVAMVETIAILRALWSGQPFAFDGELFSAKGEIPFLPPVQQPHVPIMLAGGGEKVTLPQVARFADAANSAPTSRPVAPSPPPTFAASTRSCAATWRTPDDPSRPSSAPTSRCP